MFGKKHNHYTFITSMKALVIGASGATGKDLVNCLLQDPRYTGVNIFVRRPQGMTHSKLTEIITDFENPEHVAEHIQGDVLFSCLGTTLKDAGTTKKQWHIDYEIPLAFAGIARRNCVRTMVLLSAYGASPKSKVFYSKMKGALEDGIAGLAFNTYIIFRPGMLVRKDTDRMGERIAGSMLNLLNAVGLFRKFRPLPTSVLAEKMIKAPHIFTSGTHIVALNKIAGF
jgi:uncharacterized protein YbjT (DUF2867 family)